MKISEILEFLETEHIPFSFTGDPEAQVEGFSSLAHYKPGSFTWVKAQKNLPDGFDLAGIQLAFLAEEVTGTFRNAIRTPESKHAFFSTIEHFYGEAEERPAIGQFTYISPKVKLGKNVHIGHNCTLDGDITIGDDTVIWNNVVILNRVEIGRACEIQSGVVIGHDGFAYTEDEAHKKSMVKHFGGVIVGDSVYLGAGTTIERGTIDDTVLASGCKVDCCCLIGHNSRLEENCSLVGQSLLLGSVHLKKNSYLASAVIRNQCTVGEDALVGIGAVVVKDVEANQTVVGNPAKPFTKKKG